MQLVCVCIYTTQKDYTVRCKSHLATKNHRGREKGGGGVMWGGGSQRGSKVNPEHVRARQTACQTAAAKQKQFSKF